MTLEGFRSYKDSVTIGEFSGVNIFIGPNNAGKSNIIEALKYLNGLVRGYVRDFSQIVFDRDRNLSIQLSIDFVLSSDERRKIIHGLFPESAKVSFEDVKKSPFLSTLKLRLVMKAEGVITEEIKGSNLVKGEFTIIKNSPEGDKIRRKFLPLDNVCTNLKQLGNLPDAATVGQSISIGWKILQADSHYPPIIRDLINRLRRFMQKWYWFEPIRRATPRMKPGEERTMASSGDNLVKLLNSILSENPRRYVSLINEILQILPDLSDILSPLRGEEAILNIKERGLGTPTDLDNISFGVMQTLILAVGIMTHEPDSIILIEEPELHLHAASQRKLFKLVQKEAERKQFFITTHSSIFTGCKDKINTFLVTKRDAVTNVRKIIEPSELKLIKNALGHRNTDLFGYECVVFIEGDSEEVSFPIIAEALGYDLVEMGICLINIRGKGKVSKIAEYLRYLKDSDVLPYVVADGDKEVRQRLDDWVKEGLLQKDCQTVWDLEFEDCFMPHMIINSMKEVAKEHGFKFEITLANLKENQLEGRSIVKALGKLLYQKGVPSLDKPALAENLALLLKREIEKENTDREKTPPEQVIEKIVRLVEAKWKGKT